VVGRCGWRASEGDRVAEHAYAADRCAREIVGFLKARRGALAAADRQAVGRQPIQALIPCTARYTIRNYVMPVRRLLTIAVLCVIAFAAFFVWSRSTRNVLPTSPIDRITIDEESLEQQPRHIADPQYIATIIGFLHQHDKGWYTPFGTYPGQQHTLTFYQRDQFQYVVWLGSNWLGYRRSGQTAADNLITNVPKAEIEELLQLLGIHK